MSRLTRSCRLSWIALTLSTLPAVAQNQHDMTFHTVPPCTVVDTRVAGGAFAANETRTYNVVGSGSFASQGGSATGCGVPGFSNGIAQVQAVALVFTAISPGQGGYIAANAADQAVGVGAVVSFQPGDLPTNTSQVAMAQTSGVGDFKVLVAYSTSHVLVRVVGYYSKPVQTVYVHPVPGNQAASGTALLNAMNGITNASATKRYVVKLEPGIYDLGSTMLTQKPYVDLEGSGQQATVIQGLGNEDFNFETAVVKGASSAEIRDLQIKSAGQGYSYSIALLIQQADTSVRDVILLSGSASQINWGIRHPGDSSAKLAGVTITVSGGTTAYGFSSPDFVSLSPIIENTVIDVSGASVSNGIFSGVNEQLDMVRNVRIKVSAGQTAHGINLASFSGLRLTNSTITVEAPTSFGIRSDSPSPLRIEQSQVSASGTGNSYGIYATSGGNIMTIDHAEVTGATNTVFASTARIGATRLDGGPVNASVSTCAGVYDESFTFFAGPACP